MNEHTVALLALAAVILAIILLLREVILKPKTQEKTEYEWEKNG